MKRTPLKRTQTTLKKSSLKRKSKTVEEKQQQSEDITRMHKLFEEHWISKWVEWYHQCESCGCTIYGENKSLYHHHVLEKAVERYKHLKYELGNLMLLCADCHTRVTNGFPSEEVKRRTEQVKQKYGL